MHLLVLAIIAIGNGVAAAVAVQTPADWVPVIFYTFGSGIATGLFLAVTMDQLMD